MTTQELVERLREGLPYVVSATVWAESDALKAEAASRLCEMEREIRSLSDPVVVHINMLRGGIAKPSVANIIHLYGADVLRAALEHQQKGEGL